MYFFNKTVMHCMVIVNWLPSNYNVLQPWIDEY